MLIRTSIAWFIILRQQAPDGSPLR